MKLSVLLTGFLSLAVLSDAAPRPDREEAAAARRIDQLQRQYQRYIRDTIRTRRTGCTSRNILRRREW